MKGKTQINKLKTYYAKVPAKIFEAEVSPNAALLYCFFFSLAEEFNPGLGFISFKLRLSKKTILKYIRELESRNIVRKYKEGGFNEFNKYELILPKEWK